MFFLIKDASDLGGCELIIINWIKERRGWSNVPPFEISTTSQIERKYL